MSKRIDLNDGWEFVSECDESFIAGGEAHIPVETVRLPHTGDVLPFNYTDELTYQKISGYRRRINLPKLAEEMRLFVTFNGAAHEAVLYFNGKEVAHHRCGYTAFTAELTEFAVEGENLISLRLDSRESINQPPFGNVIDYLTYSGLYRGCYLEITNRCFIADAFVTAANGTAGCELIIAGMGACALTCTLLDSEERTVTAQTYDIKELEQGKSAFPESLPVDESECLSVACTVSADAAKIQAWNTDRPVLYTLRFELKGCNGKLLDEKNVRFGFRKAEFRTDGFYLNGEKLLIRGLNRHQSYPYTGYAMPDSVQRHDADILKYELGLIAVRTSHYPQSQAFIDRCDEIGLLVFTEIPGWQHIGDEEWKAAAVRNVEEMVVQNRNHPSVILWGVRINESQDDDELYLKTNKTAHSLDPSRQTGGVRYIRKSSLLEDVYTYNDFSHTGGNRGLVDKETATPDVDKPYMVTEFNGHMFPTKSFDNEEHRLEHALRHARVLDAMYGGDEIAGCFGWCAFDYNTHKQFGSGDRICYHGVMDMFRNPKPAAWVYASQSEDKPVLEISSSMDIGEHPGGHIGVVYAFTNADFVRVYKNDVMIREFYPDFNAFPNLPHPPVKIDDYIGDTLEKKEGLSLAKAEMIKDCLYAVSKYGQHSLPLKYRLKTARLMLSGSLSLKEGTRMYKAYIGGWGGGSNIWRFEAVKDGKTVASREAGGNSEVFIRLDADKTLLKENGGYDAACVRISAMDGNGNRLWYYGEPVLLFTEGPIEIIGPRCVSLRGGASGTYVKTTGDKGRARLIVRGASAHEVTEEFTVV
jgi:beta-galactosidase